MQPGACSSSVSMQQVRMEPLVLLPWCTGFDPVTTWLLACRPAAPAEQRWRGAAAAAPLVCRGPSPAGLAAGASVAAGKLGWDELWGQAVSCLHSSAYKVWAWWRACCYPLLLCFNCSAIVCHPVAIKCIIPIVCRVLTRN